MDSTVTLPLSLVSPLLESAGFPHGFSTRGADVGDFGARFASAARLGAQAVHQVKQVHGAAVVVARGSLDDTWQNEADAVVARGGAGPRAVGVRVADCVPLLVGDPSSGSVAAIHAGWRGVVAGVIARAFDALAPAGRVVCAVGPCIGPCCFEVGRDVAAQIAGATADDVVARRQGDKAWIDLRRAVRLQLQHIGVESQQVDDVPGCTFCDAERFFSYRREKGTNGRHLAAISTRARAQR
jgi:hypothetical protein